MARTLTADLDIIMRGDTDDRRPGYQILVYDVRSTPDTIRDIVLGNTLQTLTGPLDITPFITSAKIAETAGSYTTGVASTQVGIQLVDAEGTFNPLDTVATPTATGRFFRDGNVLRIIEGDVQVSTADWPITFTGELLGQAGYNRNRTTRTSEVQLKAVSREATFLGYKRTSEEFTLGTTYITAADSIAEKEMGLDVAEVDFPTWGAAAIPHKVVQLVDENPISMLAYLMFQDFLIPRFTGAGKLSAIQDRATGAPQRLYVTRNHITSITRPASDVKPPTSVCVKGLDSTLSRVDMPNQALATADITIGFFSKPERLKVFFRDDKTLFADNVKLKTFVSVDGGINFIGAGEKISLIQSGDPDQIGTVGVILEADSGFAPWIVVNLAVGYIAASFIPDSWFGFGSGPTISIGRVIEAVLLILIMLVMTKVGRGSYAFTGDPFEYVYREIRQCAKVSGVSEFDEHEITLENHLVNTAVAAEATAFQVLVRKQAEKAPRSITMIHDVALEPNDIFELQDDSSRYLVLSINRTLAPTTQKLEAQISALEVTLGIAGAT